MGGAMVEAGDNTPSRINRLVIHCATELENMQQGKGIGLARCHWA